MGFFLMHCHQPLVHGDKSLSAARNLQSQVSDFVKEAYRHGILKYQTIFLVMIGIGMGQLAFENADPLFLAD